MTDTTTDRPTSTTAATLGGVAVVIAIGAVVRVLDQGVPAWTKGTGFGDVAAVIEYPVYAIVLGLLGNVVLTQLGVRDRLAGGFRTEF